MIIRSKSRRRKIILKKSRFCPKKVLNFPIVPVQVPAYFGWCFMTRSFYEINCWRRKYPFLVLLRDCPGLVIRTRHLLPCSWTCPYTGHALTPRIFTMLTLIAIYGGVGKMPEKKSLFLPLLFMAPFYGHCMFLFCISTLVWIFSVCWILSVCCFFVFAASSQARLFRLCKFPRNTNTKVYCWSHIRGETQRCQEVICEKGGRRLVMSFQRAQMQVVPPLCSCAALFWSRSSSS